MTVITHLAASLKRTSISAPLLKRTLMHAASAYPASVRIVEVSPRDGLQNVKQQVPTDVKVELINRLSDCGITYIEPTSFVSPKWVPQMADGMSVMEKIKRKEGVTYAVPLPNLKGLEMAKKAKVEEIAIFSTVSETFSQKNTNASIRKVMENNKPLCEAAVKEGMKVRGYVSCVMGCPYEGEMDPKKVALLAKDLYDMGCYEISLGDTIGTGNPGLTFKMLEEVKKVVPIESLAVHFHDTYGQALSNILVALQQGVSVVDSSVAGLGGCPYAKGASGNVATEDVVYMLEGLGIKTGIDMDKLIDTAEFISSHLGHKTQSKAGAALFTKRSRM